MSQLHGLTCALATVHVRGLPALLVLNDHPSTSQSCDTAAPSHKGPHSDPAGEGTEQIMGGGQHEGEGATWRGGATCSPPSLEYTSRPAKGCWCSARHRLPPDGSDARHHFRPAQEAALPTSGGGIWGSPRLGRRIRAFTRGASSRRSLFGSFQDVFFLSSAIIGPNPTWDQTVEMFYGEDEPHGQEKLRPPGLRWGPFPGEGGCRRCLHRNGSKSWSGLF